MNFNQVTIAGRLGRDPELRYIPSGTAVCDIAVAVSDKVKKGDEWVEKTCWVDVTLWSRTAEIANEYLKKGSVVLISGRLEQETWQDKEGNKRSKLKIVASTMQMGSKSDRQSQPESREAAAVGVGESDPFDDNSIPF